MSFANAGTFHYIDEGVRWEIGPAKFVLRIPTIAEIRELTISLQAAGSEERALHEVALFVGRLRETEMGRILAAGAVAGVPAEQRRNVPRGVLAVARQHCEVGLELLRGLSEADHDVSEGLSRLHEYAEACLFALNALKVSPGASPAP